MTAHLAAALPLPHGGQRAVPVQQLEHRHQFLQQLRYNSVVVRPPPCNVDVWMWVLAQGETRCDHAALLTIY